MIAPTSKEAVVQAYMSAFARGDAAAIADLYAADGRVEDPYGSPAHVGRDAILAFYTHAMTTGAKLHLDGPVRIAGDVAAFAFHVALDHDGQPMRIDVIDLFHFDGGGKIALMQAFWGESNTHVLASGS